MHTINRNNTRIIPVTVRKTIKLKPVQRKIKGPTCWRLKSRANCAPMRRAHVNETKIHIQRVCATGQTHNIFKTLGKSAAITC